MSFIQNAVSGVLSKGLKLFEAS